MWIFFIFALFPPLFIRFGAHFENEFASLEDFRIRDTAALMQLAVEACGLYIICIGSVALCLYHEFSACGVDRTELDFYPVEQRAAYLHVGILGCTSLHVEEAHRRHYVPRTELSLVLVLAVTVAVLCSAPVP